MLWEFKALATGQRKTGHSAEGENCLKISNSFIFDLVKVTTVL